MGERKHSVVPWLGPGFFWTCAPGLWTPRVLLRVFFSPLRWDRLARGSWSQAFSSPRLIRFWQNRSSLESYNTVDPWTMEGLGVSGPHAVENLCVTLQLALCICSSASMDSTIDGSCSIVVCIFLGCGLLFCSLCVLWKEVYCFLREAVFFMMFKIFCLSSGHNDIFYFLLNTLFYLSHIELSYSWNWYLWMFWIRTRYIFSHMES